MGADSFGARADPTTDQLKWKKVLQCYMSYFNELHPRGIFWRLEGVIWFLSNILDLHGIFLHGGGTWNGF